jgi:hypothetical protein
VILGLGFYLIRRKLWKEKLNRKSQS